MNDKIFTSNLKDCAAVATDLGHGSVQLATYYVETYFNNQLNAQILLLYNNMYVTLQSSTCFEH